MLRSHPKRPRCRSVAIGFPLPSTAPQRGEGLRVRGGHIQSRLPSVSSCISPIRGPGSAVGNEIESTCREPIVGRARHSVRAAPATSGCKISPASPSRPAAEQDFARVSVPTSEFGFSPSPSQSESVRPLSATNPPIQRQVAQVAVGRTFQIQKP